MLKIKDLIVTQHGLRNEGQLDNMISFLIDGGIFNKESLDPPGPLIHIAQFPDNKLYIQDGHHRICAMLMVGRDFLHESEYWVEDWTYEQFLDVNLDCGWVTPYDPQSETRHPDYAEYKKSVFSYVKNNGDNIHSFIKSNRDLYCSDRTVDSIPDLMKLLGLEPL